jgi:hypothetical protein
MEWSDKAFDGHKEPQKIICHFVSEVRAVIAAFGAASAAGFLRFLRLEHILFSWTHMGIEKDFFKKLSKIGLAVAALYERR